MSPISDVGTFRNARWKLGDFLHAIRLAIERAIEDRAAFDLLCHPSIIYPGDPESRMPEFVCDLVRQAGNRAAVAGLDTIGRGMA